MIVILKKIPLFFIVIVLMMSAVYSHASGFKKFVLGARAAGLGGAFVARVDDASAIYYNPAGIAFLKGIRLESSIIYNNLTSEAKYEGATTQMKSASSQIWGSYFFTWRFKDKISFGIGGFAPYSMDTNWPAHWEGNTLNIHSKLRTFYIRPIVAFKIFDGLSVGAGLDFIFSNIEWSHHLIFNIDYYEGGIEERIISKFDMSGNGIGFVVGMLYAINDKFRLGGKYQHRVEIDLEGSNSYRTPPWLEIETPTNLPMDKLQFVERLMRDYFKYQKATSHITMPSELVFGFMCKPIEKLTVQLDIQWTEWSKIKTWEFVYENKDESISPEFVEQYGEYFETFPDYSTQSVSLHWKDTLSFKLGAEYFLSDIIALKMGYTHQQNYDSQEVLNPILPDLGRNILSLGLGYKGPMFDIFDWDQKIGGLSFDVFFQYVFSESRTSSLSGLPISYEGNQWIIGFGVGFNF